MFLAGIVDNELLGPGNVSEVVKIHSEAYIAFLKAHLESCPMPNLCQRRQMFFMHDNAKFHAAKRTGDYL